MAPEQLSRGETTVASDIYSLGLVLFELFTGTELRNDSFAVDSASAAPIPKFPSSVRDIDPVVERVVAACLSDKADERPSTAMSVVAALPGMGSLETALAIGETPSTDVIAAVEEPKLAANG